MLNGIWIGMMVVALCVGALSGTLDAVSKASVDSAKSAVELAIGLVGVMAFWLGLMKVLQDGGLVRAMARALKPVLVRLFPDVPADHPAMGMMLLNFVANMLGLANAATPFGLKAMQELDKLNADKGTATNAMALFLAINTSGLALLPTGVIAARASLGSQAAGSIVLPTFLSSVICLLVAIVSAKVFIAFAPKTEVVPTGPSEGFSFDKELQEAGAAGLVAPGTASRRRRFGVWALLVLVLSALGGGLYLRASGLALRFVEGSLRVIPLELPAAQVGLRGAAWALVNEWLLVLLILAVVLFGLSRNVRVYDAVVEGGKEGFGVALKIIPFLVAILVAIGMLRASGALDAMQFLAAPITDLIGMPKETLPMAIMRPLSGSGAYGVAVETMKTYGPDSLPGVIVSTMQANETTFYVLALYFGAASVRNPRFTLVPCLLADATSIVSSVWLCRWLIG